MGTIEISRDDVRWAEGVWDKIQVKIEAECRRLGGNDPVYCRKRRLSGSDGEQSVLVDKWILAGNSVADVFQNCGTFI